MVNKEYFSDLVNVFLTEKSGNRFIANAVKRDITNEPEHIKAAFEYYKDSPVNLGSLYRMIGNDTYALNLYKETLEKLENKKRKKENTNYDMTAIERLERNKDILKIADLSSRIASINKKWADKEKAWKEEGEAKKDKEEAEKFYTKALKIYEAIGEFKFAAETAEAMGDKARAKKYRDIDKLLNPKCD